MEQNIVRHLDRGPMADGKLKLAVNAYSAGLWSFEQAAGNLKKHGMIAWDKNTKRWTRLAGPER